MLKTRYFKGKRFTAIASTSGSNLPSIKIAQQGKRYTPLIDPPVADSGLPKITINHQIVKNIIVPSTSLELPKITIYQTAKRDGGSAIAAFSPLDLSPCIWLDASVSSSVILSSGVVSQWSDLSGNNNHATQSTPSLRPNYSSSGIVFNGINRRLDGVNTSIGFYIAVLTPSGMESYGSLLGFTTKHGVIRDDNSNNWYFSVASLFPNTAARRNIGLSTRIENTIAIFSNGGSPQSVTLSLGKDDAGAAFASGTIYEIICLPTNPSTTNRLNLTSYLLNKWGSLF